MQFRILNRFRFLIHCLHFKFCIYLFTRCLNFLLAPEFLQAERYIHDSPAPARALTVNQSRLKRKRKIYSHERKKSSNTSLDIYNDDSGHLRYVCLGTESAGSVCVCLYLPLTSGRISTHLCVDLC